MKLHCLLLGFILLGTQCQIDRSILPLSPTEQETLSQFQQLPGAHQLRICEADEPGDPLWLCLTLIGKTDSAPLREQEVLLYHTDHTGNYAPADPANEATARLHGTVITDSLGRAYVQTILPGDYGTSADNRHVHTTVYNAHPEAYDFHFKQFTGWMGSNFISDSDQHFLADLKHGPDSVLVAFLTMEIKNPQIK